AIDEIVDLDLDGAYEAVEVGGIAQLHFLRDKIGADARQCADPLVAQCGCLHLDALLPELFETSQHQTHDVGVQAATKAFVGGDHDNADRPNVTAFDHVGVRIVGMRLHQMSGDLAHLGCIGTACAHPFLRLAHFGCRHHLHGFGDLARVLHALDLGSNFLDSGHRSILKGRYDGARPGPALRMDTEAKRFITLNSQTYKAPCFLNSCMAAANSASSSLDSSFLSSMRWTKPS